MALWEAKAGFRPALARPLGSMRDRFSVLRGSLTWRHGVFALTLALYAALTGMVLAGWSPIDRLDESIVNMHMRARWPGINRFMLDYVMLGQRAPSTLVVVPWFLWMCHRQRSFTPLIRLVTALLLLNVSVGIVKIETGRYGPLKTSDAHHVLAGGNIFPSGHAANAVVLYGVMAMCVVTYRKTATALALWLCTTVGLTTLYLNTHWLSDIIGAWLAGGLVLMVLPLCVPRVERALRVLVAWVTRTYTRYAHASKELDPGEPLGQAPQPARDFGAPRRVRGADPARAPAHLAEAARSVEGTADGVGHGRRVERRDRALARTLRDEPVAERHHAVLD